MKTNLTMIGAIAAMMVSGSVLAEGSKIVSRSPEAAHADLVRDWNFTGGGSAVPVRERTKAEMQADLVRDWNGPTKAQMAGEEKGVPHTRTAQQAYDDLVRNWN